MTSHSYDEEPAQSGSSSVRWSAIGLAGRQVVLILSSVLIARLIGPSAYGIVAQATIFVSLSMLLLDQGLAAALVNQRAVSRRLAGAAEGFNAVFALLLATATVGLSPLVAGFFRTPELSGVLSALGLGLLVKAAAIVPRMLLIRRMRFKATAIADLAGTLLGATVGVLFALAGFGYWALVVQTILSDLVIAVMLFPFSRAPLPNFRFSLLRSTIGFSAKVFLGNTVAFISRNVDSILIGRYLGSSALAHYDLAYRVLLTPTNLVGQTITRVLFPSVARHASNEEVVSALVGRSMRAIAFLTFPLMAFLGVSAPLSVPLVLGASWDPAIIVLSILAFTGARQSVTSVTAPVLMGVGRPGTLLRFNLLAAVVQISGIVAGLPYGIEGVAWGYTVAGVALTPLVAYLQKAHAKIGYRQQLSSIWPPLHASLWALLCYLLLDLSDLSALATLSLGGAVGAVVYLAVMRVAHKRAFLALIKELKQILGQT